MLIWVCKFLIIRFGKKNSKRTRIDHIFAERKIFLSTEVNGRYILLYSIIINYMYKNLREKSFNQFWEWSKYFDGIIDELFFRYLLFSFLLETGNRNDLQHDQPSWSLRKTSFRNLLIYLKPSTCTCSLKVWIVKIYKKL